MGIAGESVAIVPPQVLVCNSLLAFGVGLIYQLSQFTSKDDLFAGPFYMWGTGLCVFTQW
jgi:hypothetical protein